VSAIWNDIKSALSSGENQLDETTKAIIDIESKKKAISQASLNEQNTIKSKIRDVYEKIGETSYSLYIDGSFEVEKLVDLFDTVKGYFKTLDENKTKLSEIINRYDEELKILKPTPPQGQGVCSGCGTAFVPGEMLFCSSCGNKLPEKDSVANVVIATSVQQSICSNCNTEIVPGAVFCAGCGSKVS
jgi:ribosomal protein L40E